MPVTQRSLAGSLLVAWLLPAIALAQPEAGEAESEHKNLGQVGAKLSNPLSDIWALFTEFDFFLSNGNVNQGDDKLGTS